MEVVELILTNLETVFWIKKTHLYSYVFKVSNLYYMTPEVLTICQAHHSRVSAAILGVVDGVLQIPTKKSSWCQNLVIMVSNFTKSSQRFQIFTPGFVSHVREIISPSKRKGPWPSTSGSVAIRGPAHGSQDCKSMTMKENCFGMNHMVASPWAWKKIVSTCLFSFKDPFEITR